ncbi:lipopolysaccharide biosynthesis protein [Sedimentisphaera salicampi]|uniref:Polysaccharide biosynthesis protein n=1 Tax=Sedimentisphaera salicampi TaxID=1941349 RepID=A0A1W6LJC4_9BACT|nr:polysaccharide biosynthesis C-terminal domain-containing protein [Sedimentisphaera salicampi]ARN55859.1 Polysaccharide biosynthesis protein [Sedimentisphaera salicampi]
MSNFGVAKKMFLNTLSNYGLLLFNMISMIILVRVQFTGLSRQDYGFWGLLWTIFGYSLLLDFGLGTAVQKYASQVTVNKNWERFNKLVSTVFFSYWFISLIIIVATVIISIFIEPISNLEPGSNVDYYRKVFLLFGFGTALIFPVGFSPGLLRGIQLIWLRNNIDAVFAALNLIVMVWLIKNGYGLWEMTIATVLNHIGSKIVMLIYAFIKLEHMRISFRFFSPSMIKEVMGFSIFVYLIICSKLIIFRTDNLVISASIGVAFVAYYQVASKLGSVFQSFAMQFNDNLGPVASVMHTSGDLDSLARMQLYSSRVIAFISTMMLVPLIIFVGPLFETWLDLTRAESQICAVILLVSQYFYVVMRSSSIQILLMCDRQKELAIVSVIECLANLLISVILVRMMGIIGVAIGTLVPNVFFGCVYNVPTACRFAKVSPLYFLKYSVLGSLVTGLVIAAITFFLKDTVYPLIVSGVLNIAAGENAGMIVRYFAEHSGMLKLLALVFLSALSCGMYMMLFYTIGIKKQERADLNKLIADFFNRKLRRSA